MKKLIILSIVLLTTLSATLLINLSAEIKKEDSINQDINKIIEDDSTVIKKLNRFNVKDYETKKKEITAMNNPVSGTSSDSKVAGVKGECTGGGGFGVGRGIPIGSVLVIDGTMQRQDGVWSLLATHIQALDGVPRPNPRSHDYR